MGELATIMELKPFCANNDEIPIIPICVDGEEEANQLIVEENSIHTVLRN
jgi:hypothetical protein